MTSRTRRAHPLSWIIGPALGVIVATACAHTRPSEREVPLAFGRWQAPAGQACYEDEFQPPELPHPSALFDTAGAMGALRARAPGSVLIALRFDSSGHVDRSAVIDRRMTAGAADSVRAIVMAHARRLRMADAWGVRLLAITGESAALTLARRELCPPALARIEPIAVANLAAITESEAELVPPPDWIVRGVPPPPSRPARSTVEKTAAGQIRDSARVSVDSTSRSPDLMAIGDAMLTLRVLIDTTGAIAHAEIARSATANLDRDRLVTELARYRFHPALEDRVPTPWWIILRIK
ncbi:MAG TPA: hypothetical protein VFB46_04865 [Gemmatimonadaceae bacterium]|nr:hypothetical protein [Gemmatimonadaceae bacterium]